MVKDKKGSVKSVLYFVGKIIFFPALFFVLLLTVLNIPAVQQYAKEKVIQTIEDKTGTKVTFDHLAVSIWSGITLEKLKWQDNTLDTLLSVEKIGFSLRKNLLYLLNNELDISTLRLEGVTVLNITKYNEAESELSRAIKKLFGNKSGTGKSKFLLSVKEIFLKDIFFLSTNENKGTSERIFLKSGFLELEKLDLAAKDFNIKELYLDAPSYRKYILFEECSPKDELSITPSETAPEVTDYFPFSFRVNKIDIEKGVFSVFNQMIPVDRKFANVMDFNHFEWKNIRVLLNDLELGKQDTFKARCEEISAVSDRGFYLKKFSVDTIMFSPSGSFFKRTKIETDGTIFSSDISLSYLNLASFGHFNEEVLFRVEMSPSRVSLADVSHFIKGLLTSPATQGINDKTVNLDGTYYGKLNAVNGKNVQISIPGLLSFGGNFSTKNLDDYNNTLLNVRLENFSTSMQKIKKLFPAFKPPANFFKLGALRFDGRYDGYIEDFVAYGKLQTDLGSVDLDMRLDITGGVDKAQYSGELNLTRFDLARWSGNSRFGFVDFTSRVYKGKGLTLKTLKTDIEAVVKSLSFNDYEYKNFFINGLFEKNNFEGFFEINDPNIDMKFDGNAEFIDNQAFLNFTSTVKNIDLKALNLSKKPFALKADLQINGSGSNLNDLLGNIDVKDLVIQAEDTTFNVNELHLTSRNLVSGDKEVKIWSDLGLIELKGQYDVKNLVPMLGGIIQSNYPALTKNWKFKKSTGPQNQRLDFDISLGNSRHFLKLAGLNDVSFTSFELKGRVDSYKNEISMASKIPEIIFKKDSVFNLQVLVNSYKNEGNVLLHLDQANAGGQSIGTIDFQANSKTDSILFDISGQEILKGMKPLAISGSMTPYENGYSFSLEAEALHLLGRDWTFSKGNSIAVTKNNIVISDFVLQDGLREIILEDIKNQGVSVRIKNFDLDIVNTYLKDSRFVLSGLSDIQAQVENIFVKEKEIYVYAEVPSFYINKDNYGLIELSAELDKKGIAEVDLLIGEFLTANALIDTKEKDIQGKAKFKGAPLKILEYILAKGIQNTAGTIDAQVDINGPLKEFKLNGKGRVYGGQTKIIYTGVTYLFDKQDFEITEYKIDLTGATITDLKKNPATVTGGLYHNRFKKFGVNASIAGDNVIGLQTTIAENPDYFGFAIGRLRAEFNGSFDKVDMVIDGVTNAGTHLSIPVGNTSGKVQTNQIRFEKRSGKKDSLTQIATKIIKGIDLEMNLTITPEASISIIFNEDKGDVISGVGRGNMQIFLKRTGSFDIFGDYQIESGKYLFTVAQLPVAKPFEVYRGGLIRWTGDPVNTTLDIQAVYKSRTSLRPFIEEYLNFSADDQLANQANQRQDVDVILKLGGTLYNPEVRFNLAFPNLVGDISTLADSKLRILQNNELELNSQVFGLIMFNNFLPSNRVSDVLGTGGIQSMGINTLSEFLSSQLSLYITNLINLALVENGLLAGVDFEIGMRNNTGAVANLSNTNVWPDEIEFRLKNRFKFLDERVTLNMGGNYVFENQGLTYNQMLPDFSVEMVLTEDRKLKARVYGRQELIVQNTLSPKVGIGLAYRTEFGSMTDFEDALKATIRKAVQEK